METELVNVNLSKEDIKLIGKEVFNLLENLKSRGFSEDKIVMGLTISVGSLLRMHGVVLNKELPIKTSLPSIIFGYEILDENIRNSKGPIILGGSNQGH